jgi:hypothetical protein
MKTASELRKGLDEALKPDTSGKTTPIQRLTPFLRDLVEYLELMDARASGIFGMTEEEFMAKLNREIRPIVKFGADDISEPLKPENLFSSVAATQAVPASPTNEPGDASKATA